MFINSALKSSNNLLTDNKNRYTNFNSKFNCAHFETFVDEPSTFLPPTHEIYKDTRLNRKASDSLKFINEYDSIKQFLLLGYPEVASKKIAADPKNYYPTEISREYIFPVTPYITMPFTIKLYRSDHSGTNPSLIEKDYELYDYVTKLSARYSALRYIFFNMYESTQYFNMSKFCQSKKLKFKSYIF